MDGLQTRSPISRSMTENSPAIIRLVKLVNWTPPFQHPTENQRRYRNPPYFHLGTSARRKGPLYVNSRTLEPLP
jgi:hypothetical protein